VSTDDKLQWEARLARPAALAAFAAGLLTLAGTVVFQAALDDRAGTEAQPDLLLSIDDSPGNLIASAFLQATAVLSLILVFYYLFRATIHRVPQMPRWFAYLIFVGPAMYAISQILVAFDRVDVAEMFADRSYSFDDAEPGSELADCPAIRGELGGECAEELLSDNANAVAIGLNLAGSVGLAFLYVMLPLRARRAGLLSPFMSILGVVAGVLIVLPLLPLVPVVIQAFWLGAIGALYLGNWPGGRGPAWDSGEPEPWPVPERRRGILGAPGDGEGAAGESTAEDAAPAEPEPERREPEPAPAPERPSSRKRKRKRR
jgi:hypothetical protein